MKIHKTIYTLIIPGIIILCCPRLIAANKVLSDPDHTSTALEYRGVPDVKIGDAFGYDYLSFEGFAEMRNESRFNQGALPNHNWRGFISAYYTHPLFNNDDKLKLTSGFEHESAHPSIGFNDGNNNAYAKIYDNTYRNINLNSVFIKLSSTSGSGYELTISGDSQFYFYSRNTPELPVNNLTWSEGISGGIEFKYPSGSDLNFFISAFDRYIFQSRKKTEGNIYHNTSSGVETRFEKYPIINNMNTISAKTGIIFNSLIPGRKISIYCGILYGNIYGFVDSREKRTVYSFGVETYQ